MTPAELAQSLKEKARQLGFTLAGITNPSAPEHLAVFHSWLAEGHHGQMAYLETPQALAKRADPLAILPECRSILVLGLPYSKPPGDLAHDGPHPVGRIAAYAGGEDYHLVIPERLRALVAFLEEQAGRQIPNRYYTDTGPILERDLAARAGLGWIGKNTCLINPRSGSYFLLAEILLGIDLPSDPAFKSDHCGSCTRCIDACPTACILPNRTIDARRCISYLTIENKAEISVDLRPRTAEWIFGCDICQMVCPWNVRFAPQTGDPAFIPRSELSGPALAEELALTPGEFNRKFNASPVKRAKRRGYLRNVAVAAANSGQASILPALKSAAADNEPLIREHAQWAIKQLENS